MIVSVVVALPFVARLIVDGLKLQLLSEGSPVHIDGVSVTLPLLLNPFCAVNVSVVDPDWPGRLMLIVVGLAVTVNVGAGFTVSVIAVEVEPE